MERDASRSIPQTDSGGMAQRRRSGGKKQPERQVARFPEHVTATLPNAVIWSLLFARWLLPAEGSAQGETLWLTALTLFAAALIWWVKSRNAASDSDVPCHHLTSLDGSVLLLCGSQVFATLVVLMTEGNRRTALNLGWEWTSLVVLFLLLRASLRIPRQNTETQQTSATQQSAITQQRVLRTGFVRAVVAIWIALAGYGLWQHAFWYPATLKAYEQSRANYDAAMSDAASGTRTAATQDQLRTAAAALSGSGVPLSGPARELFERRLRDSQEPLGFFALANSFAGCLAVVVVLLMTLLVHALTLSISLKTTARPANSPARTGPASPVVAEPPGVAEIQTASRSRWLIRLLAILLPLLLTAACLILTKSRTAWCGTLAGLGLAAALSLSSNRSQAMLRRGLLIAAGLVIVIGGLVGTATLTGGLDLNVIREAPKSLKYRLEYWSSTLAVIAEHPLRGVGPGQFRDAYLRHKLPESSEEIADPHQAFLDVWANAGLPALLGLLGVVGFAGRNVLGGSRSSDWRDDPANCGSPEQEQGTRDTLALRSQAQSRDHSTGSELTGLFAVVLAFGIVLVAKFVLEAKIDIHALTVGAAATVCWWLLKPVFSSAFASPGEEFSTTTDRTLHIALSCGFAALLVHLLGAGGIAMPAVTGLLFVLALLTEPPSGCRANASISNSQTTIRPPRFSCAAIWAGGAATTAVLSVGCSLTAFVPDQSCRSLLAAGDFEAAQGHVVPQAERLYRDAAAVDVLSPDPWQRLSEVAFQRWSTTGLASDFDRGVETASEALRRSPHTAAYAYHLGHWFLKRAEREVSQDVVRQSVEWLDRAVAGYPTEPQWLADLAIALDLAGHTERATITAAQTLALDKLNHKAGHLDRYLSEDTIRRLRQIEPVPTGHETTDESSRLRPSEFRSTE
ncbi:hypothetical protein GC176_21050 [bacterium]|nr:hypothetical protein [bacterium]